MSRRTLIEVCCLIVVFVLLAVPAARPGAKDEPPADPVRQQLHDLAESQQFAEER